MAKPKPVASPHIKEVKPGSFIYEIRHALAPEVCEEMIRRFEAMTDQQYQGRIGQQHIREKTIKVSTDLRISGRDDWKDIDNVLLQSLSQALNAMSVHHPYLLRTRSLHVVAHVLEGATWRVLPLACGRRSG